MNAAESISAVLAHATALRESGRFNAATALIVARWRTHRADFHEAIASITFLRESGAYAALRELLNDATERWPNSAQVAVAAGENTLALGDFGHAARAFRSALALDRQQGTAWIRLALCGRYTEADDPDITLFSAAWSDESLNASAHICAGFALGKALDDIGAIAGAIAVLREANALAARTIRWNAGAWRAQTRERMATRMAPPLTFDSAFVPVFIVGLPRSGTTLVASMLGRDARICERGELNWIDALYTHLQTQNKLHDPAALASIAQLIRTQMIRDDAPARFYIDKNPLNFRYLDFIATLFPNAKVIHCRRNVRDTALSIWMQHFAHEDLGFSYDFSDIATVAEDHATSSAHWCDVLALETHVLDYASFVADPHTQIQLLLRFLGLHNAELSSEISTSAVLEPLDRTQPAPIATASVWQARQPVHTRSVNRAQLYLQFLPELERLFPTSAELPAH